MIKCPVCKHVFDVLSHAQEEAYLEVIRIAGSLGTHSNLILEYALLRGGGKLIKGRELKLLRILTDLEKLWTKEEFSYNGRVYKISRPGILQSIKSACDRLKPPLPHDNYLKKIMIAASEAEADKRSAEKEKNLVRQEREQRNGGRRIGETGENRIFEPEEAKKLIREFLHGGTPNEQ